MNVSYQWIILIFVTLLLAVRPTIELFVGIPSSVVTDTQVQGDKEEGGKIDIQEHLIYRPNERDKSKLILSPGDTGSSQSNRSKKVKKLRRKRAGIKPGTQSSDSIVFPGPAASKNENLENRQFVVPNTAGPPPCAQGDTFCESVDEYPSEHVIRILRKEPIFVRGFFQDEKKQYSLTDDVQDRIDASDENPLCAAREHTVYPKMAQNFEGNWLFVINQDEYIQGVRVEKCLNDRECSLPASLPNGYRSQCKQKYIYRKLVALNGSGQGVISDSFQFPSCCSCVIKLDHGVVHNRFGGGGGAPAALPLTLPKTTPTPSPLRHKTKT